MSRCFAVAVCGALMLSGVAAQAEGEEWIESYDKASNKMWLHTDRTLGSTLSPRQRTGAINAVAHLTYQHLAAGFTTTRKQGNRHGKHLPAQR